MSKKWNNPYDKGGPFSMLTKKKETERKMHIRIVRYMKLKYPSIRFISTLDGEKFGKVQAIQVRDLQWGTGAPDMLIFHPNGQYVGLALELKRVDANPFKKDGELRRSVHLQEQSDWLDYLADVGWLARFGVGYDNALDIIDQYINYQVK